MKKLLAALLFIFLTACTTSPNPTLAPQPSPTPGPATHPPPPSATYTPMPSSTPSATPTPEEPAPTHALLSVETLEAAAKTICGNFVSQYLTTCLSPIAYQTYALGLQSGNDPRAFIVIGDSNSVPAVFMGHYERCCTGDLQEIADWFAGSFSYAHSLRQNGLSVKDVTTELLAAEIARHNPALAFLALGSNWGGGVNDWAQRYERIILALLNDHHVLPVLWTVTDTPHLNVEIRALAEKHSLPLVEWAAIGQPYLSPDGVHFTVPGWSFRSRVGLEVLHQLRQQIVSYEQLIRFENSREIEN